MLLIKNLFLADLRQKSLLFWEWIFPFLLMTGFALFLKDSANKLSVLAGLLSFFILQSIIFGIPFRIAEYNTSGLLQLISEEGKGEYLLFAFLGMKSITTLFQCLLYLPVGMILLKLSLPFSLPFILKLLAGVFLGIWSLGNLALLIGIQSKTQGAALGLSQMFYILLAGISGIFYPLSLSPIVLQVVGQGSPLTYLNRIFTAAMHDTGITVISPIILLLFGSVLAVINIFILNKVINSRKAAFSSK